MRFRSAFEYKANCLLLQGRFDRSWRVIIRCCELSFYARTLSVFWLVVIAHFVIKLIGFYSVEVMCFGGVVGRESAGGPNIVVGDVMVPPVVPSTGVSVDSCRHLSPQGGLGA